MKASGYKARGKKKMDYPELKKGDTVRYVDLKKLCAVGGQSSSRSFLVGVVSEFKVCNEEKLVTHGWVLIERDRYARQKDRRLGRFAAVPRELCELQRGHPT